MAAFVNSVYLVNSFIFTFVDNLHHMVEHWEEEAHSAEDESTQGLTKTHDDVSHIHEMTSYLTLFTFLRMVILGAYLYFESKN